MSKGAARHATAPVLGIGALFKGTSTMPRMWTRILQMPVHIIPFLVRVGLEPSQAKSLRTELLLPLYGIMVLELNGSC